ncbi:hypothetical protein L218DRAFT_966426 [Marasmius fiardii PR-910]|nr:hypothetical protein L218DRAFT_966426 [Marasmius fiardii PR-910]
MLEEVQKLLSFVSKTRTHVNQAVETIKLCRKLQELQGNNKTVGLWRGEQIDPLQTIVDKAEQALNNGANGKVPSKNPSTTFQDFYDKVTELVQENHPLCIEFKEGWKTAEKKDANRKVLYKKALERIRIKGNSSKRKISICLVDLDVKVFNLNTISDPEEARKQTDMFVEFQQGETVDGLLWLLAARYGRTRFPEDDICRLRVQYCPRFYDSKALESLYQSSATIKHVDAIGEDLSQSLRSLRLLFDRPFFSFEVVLSQTLSFSYGNLWRLDNLTDSPFVLRERYSGTLKLSTSMEVVGRFGSEAKLKFYRTKGDNSKILRGRADQDIATWFSTMLDSNLEPNQSKVTLQWKLQPKSLFSPSSHPTVAPNNDSTDSEYDSDSDTSYYSARSSESSTTLATQPAQTHNDSTESSSTLSVRNQSVLANSPLSGNVQAPPSDPQSAQSRDGSVKFSPTETSPPTSVPLAQNRVDLSNSSSRETSPPTSVPLAQNRVDLSNSSSRENTSLLANAPTQSQRQANMPLESDNLAAAGDRARDGRRGGFFSKIKAFFHRS